MQAMLLADYSLDILSIANWLLWFVLLAVLAVWPANVAARKGRSFSAFFMLSLLSFPLALVLAYLVGQSQSQAAHY